MDRNSRRPWETGGVSNGRTGEQPETATREVWLRVSPLAALDSEWQQSVWTHRPIAFAAWAGTPDEEMCGASRRIETMSGPLPSAADRTRDVLVRMGCPGYRIGAFARRNQAVAAGSSS